MQGFIRAAKGLLDRINNQYNVEQDQKREAVERKRIEEEQREKDLENFRDDLQDLNI